MITTNINNRIYTYEFIGYKQILSFRTSNKTLYLIDSDGGNIICEYETENDIYTYNQFIMKAKAIYKDLVTNHPTPHQTINLN